MSSLTYRRQVLVLLRLSSTDTVLVRCRQLEQPRPGTSCRANFLVDVGEEYPQGDRSTARREHGGEVEKLVSDPPVVEVARAHADVASRLVDGVRFRRKVKWIDGTLIVICPVGHEG